MMCKGRSCDHFATLTLSLSAKPSFFLNHLPLVAVKVYVESLYYSSHFSVSLKFFKIKSWVEGDLTKSPGKTFPKKLFYFPISALPRVNYLTLPG